MYNTVPTVRSVSTITAIYCKWFHKLKKKFAQQAAAACGLAMHIENSCPKPEGRVTRISLIKRLIQIVLPPISCESSKVPQS